MSIQDTILVALVTILAGGILALAVLAGDSDDDSGMT